MGIIVRFAPLSQERAITRLRPPMNSLDTLIQDLVIANRILAREEVVDAYGHVSVRHPENPSVRHPEDPSRFLIARSVAPELATAEDIVELGLDATGTR
jgi:ribulose-5-phosphate 4-epimerase/fuculose-1-phosphate aldolase